MSRKKAPSKPAERRRVAKRSAAKKRARGADVPSLCERTSKLEDGSDAHYTDALYYSATYAERADDIAYYQGLGAELRYGSKVLEYGCGNGRIAIPLAQTGVMVTAVDRSPTMIADFQRRKATLAAGGELGAAAARRLRIKEGDMRTVRFRSSFPLVLCTFNTFLHLYTRQDVERFLARVCAHLDPRGRFVVDISVPEPEELCREPGRAYRVPRFKHPSTGEVVRYAERFDYDPLAQVLTVGMEFEPVRAKKRTWVTPLSHRQFFPQEMEALLHYNGLEVVDIHSDFEHRAPSAETETLIYHCKKRR